ncbi:OB-fold protein [Polaribacter sp. Hel1_85]|uniref:OB-fold protein n=1 Tax=Polaribacter sp. Hel1_85 TaxID=1250005 RepID=UPI00052D4089|nr:hypothetical protein [Polaribacter sp. Hel1_85]KGL64149.1 conserved hypothetical protein, tRNA-anti-like family [Polaribacter sp. Hel1_85]
MKTKKILVAILIIGIIGAFVAYKIYNKPHVNVGDTKSDITLTANKIINDFSSDESIANTNYLDKIIEVSGVISKVKIEKEKGIITLKTNDDFGSVLCHLSDNATQKINLLKEGQTITVKGICTGYLMDVILVKCEITY